MMISVIDKAENIAGKREEAGYQHFSPFRTITQKLLPQCLLKLLLCGKKFKTSIFTNLSHEYSSYSLILKGPFTTTVTVAGSVDQDLAAQNMHCPLYCNVVDLRIPEYQDKHL